MGNKGKNNETIRHILKQARLTTKDTLWNAVSTTKDALWNAFSNIYHNHSKFTAITLFCSWMLIWIFLDKGCSSEQNSDSQQQQSGNNEVVKKPDVDTTTKVPSDTTETRNDLIESKENTDYEFIDKYCSKHSCEVFMNDDGDTCWIYRTYNALNDGKFVFDKVSSRDTISYTIGNDDNNKWSNYVVEILKKRDNEYAKIDSTKETNKPYVEYIRNVCIDSGKGITLKIWDKQYVIFRNEDWLEIHIKNNNGEQVHFFEKSWSYGNFRKKRGDTELQYSARFQDFYGWKENRSLSAEEKQEVNDDMKSMRETLPLIVEKMKQGDYEIFELKDNR